MKNIAVIQIEPNYIKLLVATQHNEECFYPIEEVVEPFKLSQDFAEELVKAQRVEEASVIIKCYQNLCSYYNVEEIHCYCSSTFSQLKNAKSFFEQLATITGLKFKDSKLSEEMNSLYHAVINTMDFSRGVIINIDAFNSIVSFVNRRSILKTDYFEIGAINLANKYAEQKLSTDEFIKKIRQDIKSNIKITPIVLEEGQEVQFVGTGNIFINLSKLIKKAKKYPFDNDNNYIFSKEDFENIFNLVKTLEIDNTKKIKGLNNERADVFVAGLCMIEYIISIMNIDQITINKYDKCYGYLLYNALLSSRERSIPDVLGYSMMANAMKYGANNKRSENIYRLSINVYKQLRVLHKFPKTYVKVFRLAINMFEIGKRVTYCSPERKSLKMILNSEVNGVTHREHALAGFVVSSLNFEDFPMLEWIKYKDLFLEEDLDAVRKLSAMLKIGIGFDKFGRGLISDLNCDMLGDSVIIKTVSDSNVSLEIREAMKAESDFKKAFNKTLTIL